MLGHPGEVLGGVVLLGKVCNWGWAWRFQKADTQLGLPPPPHPPAARGSGCSSQRLQHHTCLIAAMSPATMVMDQPSKTVSQPQLNTVL